MKYFWHKTLGVFWLDSEIVPHRQLRALTTITDVSSSIRTLNQQEYQPDQKADNNNRKNGNIVPRNCTA